MSFRWLTSAALIGGCLFFNSATALAQSVPAAGSPLATNSRPRIWVTQSNLSALRAKLGSGGPYANDFKQWMNWLDSRYGTIVNDPSNELAFATAAYAFAYVTHPVPGVSYGRSRDEYAAKAKELLYRAQGVWSEGAPVMNGEYVAAAYDWIHPTLSGSDRTSFINFFKTVDANGSAVGLNTNPFNSLVVSARGAKICYGIAAAGDGVDDAWAAANYGLYQAFYRSTTGVTKSESDLAGEDGGVGQGGSYGFSYTARYVLQAEEAWRTAAGLSVGAHYGGADSSFIRRLPQHFAYQILPYGNPSSSAPGGRKYYLYKSQYMGLFGVEEREFSFFLTALSGLLSSVNTEMSGLAQWLVTNRTGALPAIEYSYLHDWLFAKFIAGAGPIAAKSPSALGLPLARQFKDGRFQFRTGWDSPQDSFVVFWANEWIRNDMSPRLPGSFTVDRMGPQVINQGGFSGHDWGAGGHAGSANMLLFVDTTKSAKSSDYDDEGGARLALGNMRGSIDFVENGPNDARDQVRFQAGTAAGDMHYVYADVTRAYNSSRYTDGQNPGRVAELVRQMFYLPSPTAGSGSDLLIIFDRASSTDTRFEKRWMFHTSGEPIVNGSETAGQPVRGNHGSGKWSYTGTSRITATNTVSGSNGKVFLTPLLPAGRTVVKVGGPDSSGRSWTQDSHEFESPFGVHQPFGNQAPQPEIEQYIGRYRIEIIPSAPAQADTFLNVVEVTDAGNSTPKPAAVLSAGGLIAARVADRIVAFNRVTANVAAGSVSVDQGGTYHFHFADLTPGGEYHVVFTDGTVTETATQAGTLAITRSVAAGSVVQLKATGVVSVPPPTPTPTAPASPSNLRIIGGGGLE